MKIELLTQADRVLSQCGRFVAPPGTAWVDIPIGLQYGKYLPAVGISQSPTTAEEKLVDIDNDAVFILKAFQAFSQPASVGAVYWQLRFPNGKSYQSNVCAASEEFNFSSFRQTIDPPVECAPGSKFVITTDGLIASGGSDVAITVLLEGVLRYTIKGVNAGCTMALNPLAEWLNIPRFPLGDPNQNLMAPEWRLGNQCYPETPPGYRDEYFIYCIPKANAISVAATGVVVGSQRLQIGPDADFVVRALSFITSSVGGGSGSLFWRIRDHTGYEITDGFCNATRMATVMFPELWLKTQNLGGALMFDLTILDSGGVGSINVQPIAFGVKRKKQ